MARPDDLADNQPRRHLPHGAAPPPLSHARARAGVDRPARLGIAERARNLPSRRGVYRHRLPAVRLHADRRPDRSRYLLWSQTCRKRLAATAQDADCHRVTGELRALTSVRGIAAWLVVLF